MFDLIHFPHTIHHFKTAFWCCHNNANHFSIRLTIFASGWLCLLKVVLQGCLQKWSDGNFYTEGVEDMEPQTERIFLREGCLYAGKGTKAHVQLAVSQETWSFRQGLSLRLCSGLCFTKSGASLACSVPIDYRHKHKQSDCYKHILFI